MVYFNHDKERSDEYDLVVRCGEPKISAYLSGKSVLAETTRGEVEIIERAIGSPIAHFL